jgi:hypothetical protein
MNREQGIRVVQSPPDGGTQALPDTFGRQTIANQMRTAQFIYFDVDDTYMSGGRNSVVMTIAYHDVGFQAIYLEYDSYDPLRPAAMVDDVTRRRVAVALRTNSEDWKTAHVLLDDARFSGAQPGGADFRIGSTDELTLRNVSVLMTNHQDIEPTVRINIDGLPVLFNPDEVQPYIEPESGRTLVPVRAIFRALGIRDEDIRWDPVLRRVEAFRGQTTITLTIDSPVALVNGVIETLDQPAVIRAGRTLVPLRFVTKSFGLTPAWDDLNRIVTLHKAL